MTTLSRLRSRQVTVTAGNSARLAQRGDPLLDVRGLSVDYGIGPDAVSAVIDADLTLRQGEVLGLAGESGSGKSTLAYAITRLLRAPGVITGGSVMFYGARGGAAGGSPGTVGGAVDDVAVPKLDLLDATEHQLRELRWAELAVVLQSAMHALNPVQPIHAQLTDVLLAHRPDLDKHARLNRAAELLGLVGIPAARLNGYPHELSGGMRQRVMIAMALALEPRIVIMDEPTTALDVVTQREILAELMSLRDRLGFSIVFITHDLSLLIEIADTIAVMYAGRIVETASARALYQAPRHPYTLGLLRSFPALHGPRQVMTGIPGSPPDLRDLPGGCVFHPRCPQAMAVCKTDPPRLIAAGPTGYAAQAGHAAHPGEARPGRPAARAVACWLHVPGGSPPEELAQPDPEPIGAAPSVPAPRDEPGSGS